MRNKTIAQRFDQLQENTGMSKEEICRTIQSPIRMIDTNVWVDRETDMTVDKDVIDSLQLKLGDVFVDPFFTKVKVSENAASVRIADLPTGRKTAEVISDIIAINIDTKFLAKRVFELNPDRLCASHPMRDGGWSFIFDAADHVTPLKVIEVISRNV